MSKPSKAAPKYGPGGSDDWDDHEEPDESEDDTRPASEGCQGAEGCACCASGNCTGDGCCACGSVGGSEKVDPDGDDDDSEEYDEPTPPGGMTISDVHVPGPLNQERPKKNSKKKKKASKDANGEKVGNGNPQEGEVRKGSSHFNTPDGSKSYMYFELPPIGNAESIPAGEWVHYRPKPGTFKSPRYGEINITAESNREMVDGFNNHVYQEYVPIDVEHETKLSGAHGWMQKLRLEPDDSVWAYIEWNDRGAKALSGERFKYFSPEWYDSWEDPATGEVHQNVAIGGALTTRPFFKPGTLTPVLASELVPTVENVGEETMTNEDTAKKLTEVESELEKERTQRKQFAEALDIAQAENKKLTERLGKTEEQEKQLVSLTERLVVMEQENSRREFRETAREFPGDTDKHVALMEQLPEASRADYIELQKAAAEQIKAGALAKPIGNSPQGKDQGVKAGEAEQKMAQARKIVAESNGSVKLSEALAAAWTNDYEEYVSETGN